MGLIYNVEIVVLIVIFFVMLVLYLDDCYFVLKIKCKRVKEIIL